MKNLGITLLLAGAATAAALSRPGHPVRHGRRQNAR